MAEAARTLAGDDMLPEGLKNGVGPQKQSGNAEEEVDVEGGKNPGVIEGGGFRHMSPAIQPHIDLKGEDGYAEDHAETDLKISVGVKAPAALDLEQTIEQEGEHGGHGYDDKIQDETRTTSRQKSVQVDLLLLDRHKGSRLFETAFLLSRVTYKQGGINERGSALILSKYLSKFLSKYVSK